MWEPVGVPSYLPASAAEFCPLSAGAGAGGKPGLQHPDQNRHAANKQEIRSTQRHFVFGTTAARVGLVHPQRVSLPHALVGCGQCMDACRKA